MSWRKTIICRGKWGNNYYRWGGVARWEATGRKSRTDYLKRFVKFPYGSVYQEWNVVSLPEGWEVAPRSSNIRFGGPQTMHVSYAYLTKRGGFTWVRK